MDYQNTYHTPVLVESVLHYLAPKKGESYLDLTAGYGGHAAEILEKTQIPQEAILVDRDQEAIAALEKRFGTNRPKIVRNDFYDATKVLKKSGQKFDMILADLGLSSQHLNTASRGFSFMNDGPLDMRMDQSQQLIAEHIVNKASVANLAKLIKQYGEDPKSSQIAHLIVRNRPIQTTTQLAQLITKAWPGFHKVHPATRTFQALRIAVNNELELLKLSLPIWVDLLNMRGRIVIISFHSLEDRIVKQSFQEYSGGKYDATLKLLTRRPIVPEKNEIVLNPRARSAKLRAAVKINI